MDIHQKRREQISALADGEWDPCKEKQGIAALEGDDAGLTWLLYHQVSDALRSPDHAHAVSESFQERFKERFATEPVHLRPAGSVERISSARAASNAARQSGAKRRRFGIAGVAAAAAAAAATFFGSPALMLSEAERDDKLLESSQAAVVQRSPSHVERASAHSPLQRPYLDPGGASVRSDFAAKNQQPVDPVMSTLVHTSAKTTPAARTADINDGSVK